MFWLAHHVLNISGVPFQYSICAWFVFLNIAAIIRRIRNQATESSNVTGSNAPGNNDDGFVRSTSLVVKKMNKKTNTLLKILWSLWPFVALLIYAIIDNTVWNEPNLGTTVQWCEGVLLLAAWTGTIPLTTNIWNRLSPHRSLPARLAIIGVVNIGYSLIYFTILYTFFLAVAVGFNHLFI
jgi:hypothetical protein